MRVEPAGYGSCTAKPDRLPKEGAVCAAEAEEERAEQELNVFEKLDEQQDVVSMMHDVLKKDEGCWWLQGPDGKKHQMNYSKPKDNSAQLTRRLVAATGQFEVRNVISEASNSLVNLRMAAALCKGKEAEAARSAARRLEKLISRASRKIKDLDSEDMVKVRKVKAEKKKQQKRVEEIKQELRKKQQKRMAREHGYLMENAQGTPLTRPAHALPKMDAVTELQIARQAEAIAAAEGCAEAGTGEIGVAEAGIEGGGAGAELGAEGEAEVPAEAGVDITV